MSCEKINDIIMKYFDQEINDIEEAQLMQHLKSCENCNKEFLCMKDAFAALEDADEIVPPEDFEANVMEKINAIQCSKEQRYSKMLVMLFNVASIVSMALLLFFVADIKNFNFPELIGGLQEYFRSFLSVITAVLGVARNMYELTATIFNSIFKICFTIVEEYYYVIIAMLAALAAIQKLLMVIASQDGRNTV